MRDLSRTMSISAILLPLTVKLITKKVPQEAATQLRLPIPRREAVFVQSIAFATNLDKVRVVHEAIEG